MAQSTTVTEEEYVERLQQALRQRQLPLLDDAQAGELETLLARAVVDRQRAEARAAAASEEVVPPWAAPGQLALLPSRLCELEWEGDPPWADPLWRWEQVERVVLAAGLKGGAVRILHPIARRAGPGRPDHRDGDWDPYCCFAKRAELMQVAGIRDPHTYRDAVATLAAARVVVPKQGLRSVGIYLGVGFLAGSEYGAAMGMAAPSVGKTRIDEGRSSVGKTHTDEAPSVGKTRIDEGRSSVGKTRIDEAPSVGKTHIDHTNKNHDDDDHHDAALSHRWGKPTPMAGTATEPVLSGETLDAVVADVTSDADVRFGLTSEAQVIAFARDVRERMERPTRRVIESWWEGRQPVLDVPTNAALAARRDAVAAKAMRRRWRVVGPEGRSASVDADSEAEAVASAARHWRCDRGAVKAEAQAG